MVEMKAPNGKPSNLTSEQWHLVRTPEFKAWFGDWESDPENSSKVVDENGEPLIVYHGTSADFNVFKVGSTGGLFFSNKKESAERFSIGDLKRKGDAPKTIQSFLNIRKYYDKNSNDEALVNSYYENFFLERPFIKKQSQKNILKDKYNKFFMDLVSFGIINEEPKKFITTYGYDGIVINADNNSKSFIAFNPNQIKLADGTNTTFDGNNPDIRFEDGGGVGDVETGIIREFPIRKLIAYEWKLKEVAEEIKRGELSYSKNEPSLVSYVPELKKYLILDGHHRILEQKHDGKKVIKARISKYVPKTYNLSSNVVNLSSPLFKQGGNIESEEIKTNNMNNLNIESFYEYAKGEILNYLNDTMGVKSLNDWKFNYKGSEYFIEIFPQYNDKTNTLTRADFSIQDKSGREVGEITFDPKSGSKMFTSKSDFFGLHHKFEDGGGIKPIRELGTGHNVYFETPYYRLNKIGRSGFKYILLMNKKDDANGVPFYNYESNDLESAYKIATRFNEIYPKGVPNAVKIDVLIDDIITDNKRKQMKTDISAYKNPYEINRAIEKLIDEKGDDRDLYSPSEIEFISYYSGYGGLEKFGATGKGILYEYFTPDELCKKMWGLAYKHGYGTIGDKSVFEPSVGVGNFLKYAPKNVRVVANEINEYSKTICQLLHPKAEIIQQYFEQNFIRKNSSIKSNLSSLPQYSLVIGNPPYGKIGGTYMGMGEDDYSHAQNFVQYFIFRGLDLLHSGGLLIYIVGAEQKSGGTMFLDSVLSKTKKAIFDKADLVDAYRLPVKMFERTSVSSEIVVFKKR